MALAGIMGGLESGGHRRDPGRLPRKRVVRAARHRAGGAAPANAHRRLAPLRAHRLAGPAARRDGTGHGAARQDCRGRAGSGDRSRCPQAPPERRLRHATARAYPARARNRDPRARRTRHSRQARNAGGGGAGGLDRHPRRRTVRTSRPEIDLIEEIARVTGFENLRGRRPSPDWTSPRRRRATSASGASADCSSTADTTRR